MRRKSLLTLLVAAFAIFGLVGNAMAANTVTITSDKPIEPKSECALAGSISWNMDNQTTMSVGDVVRFLLPENVTTCGPINYFLQLDPLGTGYLPVNPAAPIQSTSPNLAANPDIDYTGGLIDGNGDAVELGFLVQANDNSRTFQMTLATRGVALANLDEVGTAATFNSFTFDPDDTSGILVVKFFNGTVTFAPNGWYVKPGNPDLLPTIYDAPLVNESENTLCVDNIDYTGTTVAAIPESRPITPATQLNFLGDFIIQQTIAAVTYAIGPVCKDDVCNEVALLASINQQGEEVEASGSFDFGNYGGPIVAGDRWTSSGYCDNELGNGIKLNLDGQDFSTGDQYTIKVTVRVGSSADADRAVFNSNGIRTAFTDNNASGNCEVSGTPLSFDIAGLGWAAAGGAGPVFDLTALERTLTITAAEEDADAIVLDMPQVDMDLEEVSAGEKVYFDVTWEKLPCGGNIAEATICVAELIDLCQIPGALDGIAFIGDRSLTSVLHGYLGRMYATTPNASLFFPYAPALNDPLFFTGICVTNVGPVPQVLTIMVSDSAGGMATYTSDTLAAGNMWVNTLDAIMDDLVDGATPLNMDLPVNVSITGLSPAAE